VPRSFLRVDSYAVNYGVLRLGAVQHDFGVDARGRFGDDWREVALPES
jgi:hypothetical protein